MPALQQLLSQHTSLLKSTAEKMVGKVRADQARLWTPENERDYWECAPKHGALGFERFCERYVRIYDRETKREVPMILFDSQRAITGDLVAGTWLVLLKGRQLGLTWVLAAYVVWRVIYGRTLSIVVINQLKEYAQDFVKRVRFIHTRLPVWMQKEITTKNKQSLEWRASGNEIELRAIVGGEKAGRSMTLDLVVLDEASRIPELDDTMAAIQPAVESGGGQIVGLSSSAGPQGYFYESWRGAYGEFGEKLTESGIGPNGFKPIFLHWSLRRGRDQAWYEREKKKLDAISPVRMKQEHPDTAQEAWEYASGRVYPLFRRELSIGDIESPRNMERYRAIDWGQSDSPQVCLWIGHVPGPPGLLVSPSCPNTIREFFAYRWDEDKPDEPLKKDDHCPDAVRYAVTTYNLTGLVWIYRELYLPDCVEKGWNPMTEIEKVHEMSGWVPAAPERRERWVRGRDGEAYESTVADRSWAKLIKLYNDNDIPCRGHKVLRRREGGEARKLLTDRPLTEKLEGIRMVSALIEGSIDLEKHMAITREQLAAQLTAPLRHGVASSLEERSLAAFARKLLARRN